MDIFSERIKRLRLDAGLNQSDVAAYINTSRSSYNVYESGRTPPVDVVVSLSKHYDVSTDYLLGLTPDKRPVGDTTTETLALLAPLSSAAGAEPLPASDLSALVSRLLKYYHSGAPAGNAPLEALRAYLRNMDSLLSATLSGSTTQVLDAINKFAIDFVNINAVMDSFIRKSQQHE